MKIWFSIRWRRDYINFETFWSTKKENGNVAAGSHLIIVDDSLCRGATATKSSNPKILNYYRQFLVKGFGDGLFEFRIFGRFKTGVSKLDGCSKTSHF